ncbi:MAG: helix-turn-helix transcriptional regulator [Anaerolineae bacterium]|nr:helix-turn-helix transcriptional regulator [Anaerolineae bacterium]
MDARQTIAIRNRIVSILVKRARLEAAKTQQECADFLGCSPSMFSQYERGMRGLSLPQLEALAYFLDVPVESLLDPEHPYEQQEEEQMPMSQIMELRQRILAVQLRKCREASGLTQQEMGEMLGCSAYMVSQYESGKSEIPLAELELAARQCGRTLDGFFDDDMVPLGPGVRQRQLVARLDELPPDVRDFVLKPTNSLYLRIALLLSDLKADNLRNIAETLLDITF